MQFSNIKFYKQEIKIQKKKKKNKFKKYWQYLNIHKNKKNTNKIIFSIKLLFIPFPSEHSLNQIINKHFSISPVSSLMESMSFISKSSFGCIKFKRPQEVICFLEVLPTSGNFVCKIFNTINVIFSEFFFNCSVISYRNSLSVHFCKTSF